MHSCHNVKLEEIISHSERCIHTSIGREGRLSTGEVSQSFIADERTDSIQVLLNLNTFVQFA